MSAGSRIRALLDRAPDDATRRLVHAAYLAGCADGASPTPRDPALRRAMLAQLDAEGDTQALPALLVPQAD